MNAILNESQDTGHEQENEVEKEVGETQQEKRRREDMELEKSIEEYANMADLAMTEDMVNDDDLLDEHLELEHPRDEDMEDERIEAISQLSPEPQTTKSLSRARKLTGKEAQTGINEDTTKDASKTNPEKRASTQSATVGTKRGACSPDLKGAAASKKLANQRRFSPKSKMLKPPRDQVIATRKVPRHEVYPSVIKSRKPVATSGSVVS